MSSLAYLWDIHEAATTKEEAMEENIVQFLLTGLGAPLSAAMVGGLSVKCFLEAKKNKEENYDPSSILTLGIVLAGVSLLLWWVWLKYGINLWQ